jgi:hypothetical protein
MLEAAPSAPNSGADPQRAESLFARLLAQLAGDLPATISFEDLTGVSLDNPPLALPYRFRIHTCDFCMLAKADPASHQHCVRNKMAANRVAIRRRRWLAASRTHSGGPCRKRWPLSWKLRSTPTASWR